MQQTHQFKQTLISTAAVGALMGAVPVLALLLLPARSRLPVAPSATLLMHGLDLVMMFLGCVVFTVVVFGLVPMAMQYLFVRAVRAWTGRD